MYFNFPFMYNNYSYVLSASLICSTMSLYSSSLYSFFGQTTICFLTKNDVLVYKYSNSQNRLYYVEKTELSFGMALDNTDNDETLATYLPLNTLFSQKEQGDANYLINYVIQ